MRLKTKLVLSVTGLALAIVLVLVTLFVGELMRQRIEQTTSGNDALAREVLLMTRQAVEVGLRIAPPVDRSDAALREAVTDALRSNNALADVMNGVVRYSPTVQDVSVTDANGLVLVSTDPDAVGQQMGSRPSLKMLRDSSFREQLRQVFGRPRVLEIAQTLQRNGQPFLVVRIGVRSTFLRNSNAPWLRAAVIFGLLAGLVSVIAAGVLANLALKPLEQISRRLEQMTVQEAVDSAAPLEVKSVRSGSDTMVRVAKTIDRLDEQMRSKEAGYTALQSSLNQMLDTLRDGVLLFTADERAVMVSDAVAHFVGQPQGTMVGLHLQQIFLAGTALGDAVLHAFAAGQDIEAQTVVMEGGRQVQLAVDRIPDAADSNRSMGTLVTLRDRDTVLQLGQELEVSRRLAAIGKLTAGVGHEVKNPINAMVVHLELLRSKLDAMEDQSSAAAQRHVEILAGEMQRLDRVVQTLADFTRPMELHLHELDMRELASAVVELTCAEMAENNVRVAVEMPHEPVLVRVDGELIRQALLNLLLNAMQAMPEGGLIRVLVRREQQTAVVEIIDQGTGIPPEVLPRVFDLYFTTKPRGSGIGLAMTYRILQMHGGALEVQSNVQPDAPDRGTAFTLRVPGMASASAESRKQPGSTGQAQPAGAGTGEAS
ncbi:MAG: two-component sensor histidine kinase [Acidobacteriota bacterium]|nr:two-component sensor histidine kinase [Acidobacteriota bacterium]